MDNNLTFRQILVVPMNPESPDFEDETGENTEPCVLAPIPCGSAAQAVAAVKDCDTKDLQWSIWELVNGKYVQRSINYREGTIV